MDIKTNLDNLENYKIYLQVEEACHEFFKSKKYLHMDLPVLSPALIPESYLEIFETNFNFFKRKEKLYLTPSPELFLKRLLVAGVGNCYYLGRAYRNSEPNSDWHLPEFTMLEFYKVGVNYMEFAEEILELLKFISFKLKRQSIKRKAIVNNLKIEYKGKTISFEKWEKLTVAQAFEEFAKINENELFNHREFFKKAKEKKYQTEGFTYEEIFTQIFTQEVEQKLGKRGFPTLLYDYPKELASLAKMDKNGQTAQRCEFYIDGLEVGGFCTELNNYLEQKKRFAAETKKRKKAGLIDHAIDKGFVDALKYGLPDCTGAGIGFERLAMIFANVDSINKLKLIEIE